MKATGGYKMIECKGLDLLAGSAVTYTGLHAELKKALESKKPVIGYGCKFSTADASPIPLTLRPGASEAIIAETNAYSVTVSKQDSATVTSYVPNAQASISNTRKK